MRKVLKLFVAPVKTTVGLKSLACPAPEDMSLAVTGKVSAGAFEEKFKKAKYLPLKLAGESSLSKAVEAPRDSAASVQVVTIAGIDRPVEVQLSALETLTFQAEAVVGETASLSQTLALDLGKDLSLSSGAVCLGNLVVQSYYAEDFYQEDFHGISRTF